MLHTPLDFRLMYTRSRCLENAFPRKSSKKYQHLESIIFESGKITSNVEESYIDLCESWKNIFKSLEVLYKNDQYQLLESSVERIVSNVIPSIRETKECIQYINTLDIGEINKDRLIESVKMFKSIDRIKKNHKMLTERFNIDNIYNTKGKTLRNRIFSICESIDTYKLSPFIKMNIALEEIKLLDFKYHSKLDESVIVESVLDYFLYRSSNTKDDIESYKRAINESKVISEDSISNIQYFLNEDDNILKEYGLISWQDKLNNWKKSCKSNPFRLMDLLSESLSNKEAICTIVKTLLEYDMCNTGYTHSYTYYISHTNVEDLSRDEYKSIVEAYYDLMDDNIIKKDSHIKDFMEVYSIIKESDVTPYDPDKIYINDEKDPENPITFTSDKFDSFKLNGLISDAQMVGKMLDKMDESGATRGYGFLKDDVHIDKDINMNNYKNYLSESGNIYYISRAYHIMRNASMKRIYEFAESMNKCINNSLSNRQSEAYISLSEYGISFGIKSKYGIILNINESGEDNTDLQFTNSDKAYVNDIFQYTCEAELYNKLPLQEIYNKLHDRNFAGEISFDEFYIISEALIMIGAKESLDEFMNLCKSECNDDYDKMKRYMDNNLIYEKDLSNIISPEIYSEAISYIGKVMNIIPVELNEALNLNNLKLAWQAFKTKAKHFSAKEKEMSRDVDAAFNNLLKSLKATFTVDHREQIIKGQVTPSLSRMFKIGIGLAGLGLATGNPYVPALTAVAGLALSKHISNKEKAMILDEIDIELQVLDREIQKAESGGTPRKYRELLTIQKNLQRERQRIYYGLSSKGKRIPMPSTVGQRRIKSS